MNEFEHNAIEGAPEQLADTQEKPPMVSQAVIKRLPRYFRYLREIGRAHV